MPKYIIERDIPGAGNLTGEEMARHFANVVRAC